MKGQRRIMILITKILKQYGYHSHLFDRLNDCKTTPTKYKIGKCDEITGKPITLWKLSFILFYMKYTMDHLIKLFLKESIELELNVGDVYQFFSAKFTEDYDFWWKIY